jgi:hypothetical protein
VTPKHILKLALLFSLLGITAAFAEDAGDDSPFHAGFLFDRSPLTLEEGVRTEFFGPAYYSQTIGSQHSWAIPPLAFSHVVDDVIDSSEYDFIYPVLSYRRYGNEYRWQLLQLFSLAGSKYQDDSSTHRFSLFPIYFQQRSSHSNDNYTAVVPFYGHLDHRLFKDQIDFVLFPLYAKTRKKDVVTYNVPYPFFHIRHGDQMHGWQLWPLYGREQKDFITRTNDYGDEIHIGGYDKKFILFPFFFQNTNGIGTAKPVRELALLPFYNSLHSPDIDRVSYGWPLGVTHTVDREKKIEEWDTPWPLIEFAHGEGKTERRIWPFFSEAKSPILTENWYLWPVYKYKRVHSPPLDRSRTRILFFLYSDTRTKNLETVKESRRRDFFPLYTWQRNFNGGERFQSMAILEPIFPNSRGMERVFGPLYSFWRSESNPATGVSTKSLFWNLYRKDVAPGSKKTSLLFGLVQYQSSAQGEHWRIGWHHSGATSGGTNKTAPEKNGGK